MLDPLHTSPAGLTKTEIEKGSNLCVYESTLYAQPIGTALANSRLLTLNPDTCSPPPLPAVARSHLGFPANLKNKYCKIPRKKILHCHVSIFKGFGKEIFHNETKFTTQKKKFVSKLPEKTKNM